MADVFVSYARADRPHAERIASVLEHHGWSVWWDRKVLAGETFEHTIQRALDEARCIVVLWSSASIASSWVKDEATEGSQRRILVPVLIDDVEIPLGFRQLQAISLAGASADADSSQFDDLVAAVGHVLRRSPEANAISPATPTDTHDAAPAESAVGHGPMRRSGRTAQSKARTVPRAYLLIALGVIAMLAVAAIWGILDRSGQPVVPGGQSTSDAATVDIPATSSSTSSSGISQTASRSDGAPEIAPTREEDADASGVLVTGKGQTLYYVFDSTGKTQLAYTSTNIPSEMFAGDYVVSLNNVRRSLRVQKGKRSVLETGRISMSGKGNSLFYVFEPKEEKALAYTSTNGMVELFPGNYEVGLNNVRVPVTVRAGEDAMLPIGGVFVPGSGSTLYYVFDAKGEKQLAYTTTNQEIELMPGAYVVELNKLRRRVDVAAGRRTIPDE